MIVGNDILKSQTCPTGRAANLKNSTYDLTVGEIIPIGKEANAKRRKSKTISPYYLEPREMVWVLSREEFNMPATVTGLATLRTTFTKQGILALNVGIIDPFFKGPISTALINFSDRPRRIALGDKFFQIAFFEHADVTDCHPEDETMDRGGYIKNLEDISYGDFSKNFMNIPTFDDDYYRKKFWNLFFQATLKNWKFFAPVAILLLVMIWYSLETGFWEFADNKFTSVVNFIKRLKPF